MKEINLSIELENIVDFFGVNDANLDVIRRSFPSLKVVGRGHELKIIGEPEMVADAEAKILKLMSYYRENGMLTPTEVDFILGNNKKNSVENANKSTPSGAADGRDVLVFGPSGLLVRARTPNQRKLVESSEKNDIVFAIGPAGTGKTYTAVALAVRALKNREIRRIILTRPAVEAGEHLGFLPGDLKEKIDPYLRPLYDALFDMIPGEKLKTFLENGVIEVAPLAFMRGRTLDHAYVILDEAQNATESQLKMFLTRMGPNAKMIVTGDMSQVDLPRNQPSGLIQATRILKNIDGIGLVFLDASDVVRHRLVKDIIHAYDKPINKEETK
ncbi:MAG: PhoH family protein [Bacteroidia bacterium]|nr:PhoH family protein [Bacteroidota bacterium]MBP6511631.1 PhoH family protein [Bacteroidia bacterium]MBP7244180.1 PhoH family protein [Bacteroidia bacterium]